MKVCLKKEDGTIFVDGRDSTRGLSKFTGASFTGLDVCLLAPKEPIRQAAPSLSACGEIDLFWSSSISNLR
jgi:hypothetical protein